MAVDAPGGARPASYYRNRPRPDSETRLEDRRAYYQPASSPITQSTTRGQINRQVVRPPAPPPPAPPVVGNNTGQFQGTTGGGGGGTTGGGEVPGVIQSPIAPPPSYADLEAYRDDTLTSKLGMLEKAYGDWKTQYGGITGEGPAAAFNKTGTAWTNFSNDLETNRTNLGRANENALQSIGNDFASRGMFSSGGLLDAVKRQEDDYANQKNNLASSETNWLNNALGQAQNYQSSYENEVYNARQEALARKLNSMGV